MKLYRSERMDLHAAKHQAVRELEAKLEAQQMAVKHDEADVYMQPAEDAGDAKQEEKPLAWPRGAAGAAQRAGAASGHREPAGSPMEDFRGRPDHPRPFCKCSRQPIAWRGGRGTAAVEEGARKGAPL